MNEQTLNFRAGEESILQLCKTYSHLSDKDIEKIQHIAESIEILGEMWDCDLFIDVPTKNRDGAMVVYHVKPEKGSNYIYSPVGQRAEPENEPAVWKTMTTGKINKNIKAKTQENTYVTQNVYPIKNDGKVIGTLILERNIEQNLKTEFSINRKELPKISETLNSFQNISDYLDDIILVFDQHGYLKFRNLKAELFFEKFEGIGNIEGKHFDELAIGNITFQQLRFDNNFTYEVRVSNAYFLMKKIVSPQKKGRIALILQDITELKNKEKELSLQLTAIREVHHRIKNNLQTIASLLRMQARRSDYSETKKVLTDCEHRIMSISLTHEMLSKNMSDNVDMVEVIQLILNNLQRCYNGSAEIDVQFEAIEPLVLNSNQATAVALIINELVQNCYDHAFVGINKGTIRITLYNGGQIVRISVQDDGIGFDEKKMTRDSLGLSIVKSYVKDKLRGNLQIQHLEHGTNVSFSFHR